MTNEEAIKQIEYAIITGNINDAQCGALKKAIEALKNPVVHGHWIKREGFITEYECSVCQHSDSKLTAIRGHYCWYCGAKMDETIS